MMSGKMIDLIIFRSIGNLIKFIWAYEKKKKKMKTLTDGIEEQFVI